MSRRAAFVVLSLILLPTVWFSASTASAATVTQYSTEPSFLAAAGLSAATQTFDGTGTPAGVCLDDSDVFCELGLFECPSIPGVRFWSTCTNAESSGYSRIRVTSIETPVSSPNELGGGYILDIELGPIAPQVIVMNFETPGSALPSAVGFYLDDLLVSTDALPVTPAQVAVTFADDTLQEFEVAGSAAAGASYFGIVSDTEIVQVTVVSGTITYPTSTGPDLFLVDNLSFAATVEDTLPPLCSRDVVPGGATTEMFGRSTDNRAFDTGIASVTLLTDLSSNVSLTVDPFTTGAPVATFRVAMVDTSMDGYGVVLAQDVAGNSCTLRADFRTIPAGPLVDEVLCSGDGILFEVSNAGSTPAGASACSSNLWGPLEPPLPPGYEPSPATDPFPCRVLTIDSPISGDTEMVYKKDGDFEPRLRLLFSESTDGGATFPPFLDITDTVRQIANIDPDPTRLGGTRKWTPVKVACAILTGVDCTTFPNPTLNADMDGYAICSGPDRLDCNDQRSFIYPGAPEICNGMDDDCDGAIDDGNPGGDQDCAVEGQQGLCAEGTSRCDNGQVVCDQTVFPTTEVCDGFDNDCDGVTDENHVFGGYLPPVNADGSSIFKWKQTIPFKFRLTDCAGAYVSTEHPTISVFFYSSGVVGSEVEDVSSSGNANNDGFYRYDPSGSQYIYNLATKPLVPGNSYLIRTTLDDGSTYDVVVSLRR